MELDDARSDFPSLQERVWFNNGAVSLTPEKVARSLEADMDVIFREGPPHVLRPNDEWPRRSETLRTIASFFGIGLDRVALMRGVSEAYQTLLRGIDWQEGDRLIISEDEEAALLLPSLHLRDKVGVEVVRLEHSTDREEVIHSLDRAITRRTRLVALSHVTTNYGWVYPITECTAVANEKAVPVFADLAHSAGVIPYSLEGLGCDFAGVLSYKWMYGPYASGFLYVRDDAVFEPELRYAGGRSEEALDFEAGTYRLSDSVQRYQYGPWAWPLVHGWAVASEYLKELGVERIHRRTEQVVTRLHDELAEIPGVEVVSPRPPHAGPLVTFGVDGVEAAVAARDMWERHRIDIKHFELGGSFLRASVPFFVRDAEVDLLIRAVRELSDG